MRNLENYKAIGKGVTPYAMRNKLINGGFDIWQRGDSGTNGYQADRWFVVTGGATVTTAKLNGSVKNYMVLTTTVAGSVILREKIEDVRTLGGKTCTISFEIDGNTNTLTSVTPAIRQYFDKGGTGDTINTGSAIDISAGGIFSQTFTLASTSGKTKGASSNVDVQIVVGTQTGILAITNVQLEEGSVATPFEQRPIGMELALCQRYYWRSSDYPHYVLAPRDLRTPTFSFSTITFPTTMRGTPDVTFETVFGTPKFNHASTSGALFGTDNEVPTTTGINNITADAEL